MGVADEQKKALECFPEDTFTKTAMVVVGEPPNEFKAKAHQQLLEEKQKTIASEVRRQKSMEAAQKRKEKRDKEEEKKKEENKEENKEEGEKDKDEQKEEHQQILEE